MTTLQEKLQQKITNRTAVVGIYGLGYVGLPLALRFSDAGFEVIGIDTDQDKVKRLNEGVSYIERIPDVAIADAKQSGFSATTEFSETSSVDVCLICVPTPLASHNEPDLQFIRYTIHSIAPFLKEGQLISLESTTYPGTTEEEIVSVITANGFTVGENMFVVYSPEREDPGNANFSTQTIPKVCGGHTSACLDLGTQLYATAIDHVVSVSSTRTAEMTKLLENIYRSVNIGLVNELKIVADKMDIDIHEVIHAAATKPFGFTPFFPGPGMGGHCIPIDPYYLTWKAKEFGVNTRFIELAGEVNTRMPYWVIEKVTEALNQHRKPLNGSRILVLGIAYKKNVDDPRESPSLLIIEKLEKAGAVVSYSDPHIPIYPKTRRYKNNLQSVSLTTSTLTESDLVLILTDHDAFDYTTIIETARLVVDTRGRYPDYRGDNLIRA